LAAGGTWKRNNLALSCDSCNTIKMDLPEEVFIAIVEQTPEQPNGRHISLRKNMAKNANRRLKQGLPAFEVEEVVEPSPLALEGV
jgi:hypothetical protein